jgi:hypothetical protein
MEFESPPPVHLHILMFRYRNVGKSTDQFTKSSRSTVLENEQHLVMLQLAERRTVLACREVVHHCGHFKEKM